MSHIKIINKVHEKLGGAVSKMLIDDSIHVIIDYFISKIENGESVSIENFGTFSPFLFNGHKGYNETIGEFYVKPFVYVKFRPAKALVELMKKRRIYFKKDDPT